MKTKLKRFFNVLPVNLFGMFIFGYPLFTLFNYMFDFDIKPIWLVCIICAVLCSIDDDGFEIFVERQEDDSHDNR